MFTLTFRLRKSAVAAFLCILCLVVMGVSLLNGGSGAVAVFGQSKIPKCATNEERVAYITSMGWEVTPEPISQVEVTVPQKFDEIYTQYAQIQRAQGFRLERSKGKAATKYSYAVLNYKNGKEEAVASLLMRGDKIIAADLSSATLGGFLKALTPPEPFTK